MNKKVRKERNYYSELDKQIQLLERNLSHEDEALAYSVANKITWCLKFKKMTKEQAYELCDRMTIYFNTLTDLYKRRSE